jgi:Polyketide cyclase / dehydrase and lipid transport
MSTESNHLGEYIDRPASAVYDYVSEPANLPEWAPGLVGSSTLEQTGAAWVLHSPEGDVLLEFAPHNDFGVLDHWVTVPSGERYYNAMRVVAAGEGSEVTFAVRRLPEMTDEDFARDTGLVAADLKSIKRILEQRPS